jgi:hypothetical protein
MRIDSSGALILSGNGGSTTNSVDISYNGTSGQGSFNADSGTGNTFLTFGTSSSGSLSEAMRIDSSGNVGIGGTTTTGWANKQLVLDAGSNTSAAFVMVNDTTGRAATDGSVITLSGSDMYLIQRESANMIFRTANTERMRIDSSGNLLHGTTSSSIYNATSGDGVNIKGQQGQIIIAKNATSTADPALWLNNTGVDGAIATFAKDGTSVGSIGVAGSRPYLANNVNFGIKLDDFGGGQLQPATTAGAVQDNACSLGGSSARWKDLYLSGGVYLGGTGSANKLDDYEEGTFTASLRGSTGEPGTLITTTGYYTKIGRDVTYNISFENVNTTGYSGDVSIEGLPFNNGFGRHMGTVGVYSLATWTEQIVGSVDSGSAVIVIRDIRSGTSWASAEHNAGSTRYLWVAGTYMTTA